MKRRKTLVPRVAAVLLLGVLPVAAQNGETAHSVVVHPLAVEGDTAELSVVAATMRDTIELSLRLLGRFAVVTPAAEAAGTPADLSIDGRSYTTDDGAIRFDLRIIDQATGTVQFTADYTADTLFDVFTVADSATVALLEALAEQRVAFGRLQVRADDPAAPIAVALDGTTVAEGVGAVSLDRIVTGSYRLTVRQDRPGGAITVADTTVTVREDQPVEHTAAIPLLTTDELRSLRVEPISRAHGTTGGAGGIPEEGRTAYRRLADPSAAYAPARAAVASFQANALRSAGNGDRYLPVRTIRVDGRQEDWAGIAPTATEPQEDAPEELDGALPQWWKIAVSPDGGTLYLLTETRDAAIQRDLWYRFWISPEGARNTPDRFQMDIRPTRADAPAVCQWWPNEAADQFEEFTLPARTAIDGGTMEVAVELGDWATHRPTEIDGEVMAGREPYARYVRLPPRRYILVGGTTRPDHPPAGALADAIEHAGGWRRTTASADAGAAVSEITGPFRALWGPAPPTATPHYLTVRGTIEGNPIDAASWTNRAVLKNGGDQLRLTDPREDNGIEIRTYRDLTGPGQYRAVGDEAGGRGRLEMGVWSNQWFEPAYGYNNLPVTGGTVTIFEYTDQRITGSYRIGYGERDTGTGRIAGYFRLDPQQYHHLE